MDVRRGGVVADGEPAMIGGKFPVPVITLRRTLDASLLNAVANDPAVRPWLGCAELGIDGAQIDLTSALQSLANVALVTDCGGFLLHQSEPGIYEVHSMFLPNQRRGRTVAAMRAGMSYMFTRTDCETLITKVPDDNKAAAGLALIGGFKPSFRREGCWNGGGVTYHTLSLLDWAMANAALEADGEWFHSKLEVAKAAQGSDLPTHGHDPAHERAVGAAVQMMRAGNIAKGLAFYNLWARFAGYTEIVELQSTPAVLDVGDAIIELRDGDMEVLLCR